MKKIATIGKECVACGACAKVCPKKAITIYKGLQAKVEENLCIGCRLCEKKCPASVITMAEKVLV